MSTILQTSGKTMVQLQQANVVAHSYLLTAIEELVQGAITVSEFSTRTSQETLQSVVDSTSLSGTIYGIPSPGADDVSPPPPPAASPPIVEEGDDSDRGALIGGLVGGAGLGTGPGHMQGAVTVGGVSPSRDPCRPPRATPAMAPWHPAQVWSAGPWSWLWQRALGTSCGATPAFPASTPRPLADCSGWGEGGASAAIRPGKRSDPASQSRGSLAPSQCPHRRKPRLGAARPEQSNDRNFARALCL